MPSEIKVFHSDGIWFVVSEQEQPLSLSREIEVALEVARRVRPPRARQGPEPAPGQAAGEAPA